VIEVEAGRICRVQHRALDVLRWERVDVDLTSCQSESAWMSAIEAQLRAALAAAEDRPLMVRLRLTGASPVHGALCGKTADTLRAEICNVALQVDADRLWMEKVELATAPAIDIERLRLDRGPVGDLCRALAQVPHDGKQLAALSAEFADLREKLPPELQAQFGGDGFGTSDFIRQLLPDVERYLLARLSEGAGQ
jgi:DNA repair protein SbcD/Mre11